MICTRDKAVQAAWTAAGLGALTAAACPAPCGASGRPRGCLRRRPPRLLPRNGPSPSAPRRLKAPLSPGKIRRPAPRKQKTTKIIVFSA